MGDSYGGRWAVLETINIVFKLQTQLLMAEGFVSRLPKETPYYKFEQRYFSRFFFMLDLRKKFEILKISLEKIGRGHKI